MLVLSYSGRHMIPMYTYQRVQMYQWVHHTIRQAQVGMAQGKIGSSGTPKKYVGVLIWQATHLSRPRGQILK